MMLASVLVCVAAFAGIVIVLRRERISLGLPIAYMGSLLLIHVPGAVAHLLDRNGVLVSGRAVTQIGIGLTALASVCFVVGVWLAHQRTRLPEPAPANRSVYSRFCLLAGAMATAMALVFRVPSFGAVIERGGLIWMLAIILGLRSGIRRGDMILTWKWLAALMVYPMLMLLFGGFMSYGIAAMITVLSAVIVAGRSPLRVAAGCVLATVVGISVFISYFEHRPAIREAVWGGAPVEERLDASMGAVKDIALFDPRNESHLRALDLRLNQNAFVGLAAARIEAGQADYLRGQTLREGLLSIIPRALWADKPMVAGSGSIVADMTGLQLAKGTAFGVGNVMEFHINFGIPGVIVGFLALGWVLGKLDRRAAETDTQGELGSTFVYFLPAVALIQPNGSMVEMISGGAAALIAGYGWRWAWNRWPKPLGYSAVPSIRLSRPAT